MIAREHVDNFLRVNNLSAVATDAEIERALAEARWHPEDVTCALSILRENGAECNQNDVTPLVQIYSDKTLSPTAISSLLRIDIKLDRKLPERGFIVDSDAKVQFVHNTLVVVAALCIATIAGVAAIYYFDLNSLY